MRRQLPFLALFLALFLLLSVGSKPALARTPMHDSDSRELTPKDRGKTETFEQPEYKSRGIAFLWSVAGIAAPVSLAAYISSSTHGGSEAWVGGLAAGGMLLGPSLGQVYAGTPKGAWIGAGVRTGGAFAAMHGLVLMLDDMFCSTEDGGACDDNVLALPLYMAGCITYIGGTIYSFVNAGRTVERYNESQSRLGIIDWSPILAPGAQGGIRTGAIAWTRF